MIFSSVNKPVEEFFNFAIIFSYLQIVDNCKFGFFLFYKSIFYIIAFKFVLPFNTQPRVWTILTKNAFNNNVGKGESTGNLHIALFP